MSAYRDLPASQDGPFPLVLFSHGFGGFRQANSMVCSGVASWGFVVASTDHLERGLAEVALPGTFPGEDRDEEDLLAMIALLDDLSNTAGDPLEGVVDTTLVASTGHSAGGSASTALLNDPMIDAVVTYDGGGTPDNPPDKPVMFIAAGNNGERMRERWQGLGTPKRLVVVAETGHNSFTDQCPGIRELGGLANLPLPIPSELVRLGDDGCSQLEIHAEEAYGIFQHFTVAHLRDAFGIDQEPIGLGDGIASAFPVAIEYEDVQ